LEVDWLKQPSQEIAVRRDTGRIENSRISKGIQSPVKIEEDLNNQNQTIDLLSVSQVKKYDSKITRKQHS